MPNDFEEKSSEQEPPGADVSRSTESADQPGVEQTGEEPDGGYFPASNSQQTRSRASPKRGDPQPSARAPTSDFLLWTQEFEPQEWEEFLTLPVAGGVLRQGS